jgi:hypothetical protein
MMGFGGMFPGLSLFILSMSISAVVLLICIYYRLLPHFTPEWTVWLLSYFAIGMGSGIGVGAVRWP